MPTGTKLDPFIKDPNAVLDYAVSWAAWLAEVADTLVTSTWSVLSGTVAIDSDVSDTTVATVWLRGGAVGEKCSLLNRVTTAAGRIDDRTIYVKIKEK